MLRKLSLLTFLVLLLAGCTNKVATIDTNSYIQDEQLDTTDEIAVDPEYIGGTQQPFEIQSIESRIPTITINGFVYGLRFDTIFGEYSLEELDDMNNYRDFQVYIYYAGRRALIKHSTQKNGNVGSINRLFVKELPLWSNINIRI